MDYIEYLFGDKDGATEEGDFNHNAQSKNKDKNVNKTSKATSSTVISAINGNGASHESWEEILRRLKINFESRWIKPIQNNAKLEDFKLARTLGAGSFGRVILVKHLETDTWYAMKLLIKEKVVKTKQVEHTINEKKILQALDFPHIVRLMYCFKDPSNLYLVLSFENGGELFTHLRKSRRFTEPMSRFYCAQVVLAFEYLHNLDIVYRDLKPENMLICSNGYTKITDLGFAKRLGAEMRTYTLCGTPEYLAPEVIKHRGYGKSADWWTLGVLIFEMTAGTVPFNYKDHAEMYGKIVKNQWKAPDFFTKELTDLLNSILTSDTSKRFGCLKGGPADIKKHRWFSSLNWMAIFQQTIRPPYVPEVKSPSDTRYFQMQEKEEHIHISGVDKYASLFKDF